MSVRQFGIQNPVGYPESIGFQGDSTMDGRKTILKHACVHDTRPSLTEQDATESAILGSLNVPKRLFRGWQCTESGVGD